jgi:hypothetical protein
MVIIALLSATILKTAATDSAFMPVNTEQVHLKAETMPEHT